MARKSYVTGVRLDKRSTGMVYVTASADDGRDVELVFLPSQFRQFIESSAPIAADELAPVSARVADRRLATRLSISERSLLRDERAADRSSNGSLRLGVLQSEKQAVLIYGEADGSETLLTLSTDDASWLIDGLAKALAILRADPAAMPQ